jgi:type I restriction enzyme, S subunit
MNSEIPLLSLRDAGVKLIDCVHKTPAGVDQGFPYIAIPQLTEGRIDVDSARRISEQDMLEWNIKCDPQEDDIVLSRRCNPGVTAVIPKGFRGSLGQNLVLLRATDPNKMTPKYLRWATRAREWWNEVGRYINVGAIFESLRCADIPEFAIPVPSVAEQKVIAHILGTLDDKIELNRKTNETLEAMAKALFKSWFVDFDPVRAKAEGRPTRLPAEISNLFPDSFEDSELGEIPSGWKIKKIGDVISRFPVGKRFDQKTVSPKGSIPVLDQSASGIVGYHDEEAGVLATKDFPLFTFANHTCAMRYMTRPFSVIQNVFPLRGNGVDTAWLYKASQGKQEITEYKGHYPDFIEKQVVVPVNGIDKIFGGDYERILIKCDINLINSAFLASIRDALLPKLISGGIRIPDAEKMLEEVGI